MSLFHFIRRASQFENQLEASRCRLWRLARSWCRNPALADDLVQETLAKALDRRAQLRDPASQHAWLCGILAHCWHDHLRRGRDTLDIDAIDEGELPASPCCPETEYQQNEVVRRVRAAVGELPSGQREVVTLVDLEEFSYAEVASILALPIGTVMSRLSRARATLRETLRERQAGTTPGAVVRRLRA